METWMVIVVIAAAILAAAFLVWAFASKKRSSELQSRFGPEYEHLSSIEGRRKAEKALQEREARVSRLHIKELNNDQLQSFARDWRNVQTRFVDDPEKTVIEADTLVQKVMDARGYPLDGFDQQADDISVDHPAVVSNYRAAHDIAESSRRQQATTEDLRQAMIHYRALFSDLLGNGRANARAS